VRRGLHRLLGGVRGEAGLTLTELLVASAMGVVLMAAVVPLLIGALRAQPQISQKSANIQTARWVLERMTRELRDGVVVDKATSTSSVSFQTYVRRTTCGGTTVPPSTSPAIKCEVTYSCSAETCTRLETEPGVYTGGSLTTIFTGLSNSSSVFSYTPNATTPTYVGVTIAIPNPSGSGALTVSDGASLRNATLSN
jgi:type II secretory pathway pseudopilin PulG